MSAVQPSYTWSEEDKHPSVMHRKKKQKRKNKNSFHEQITVGEKQLNQCSIHFFHLFTMNQQQTEHAKVHGEVRRPYESHPHSSPSPYSNIPNSS